MKSLFLYITCGFSTLVFSQNTVSEKGILVEPAQDTLSYSFDKTFYEDLTNITTTSGKSVTRFLAENYNFPSEAIDQGINGTIYVAFVSETDGSVSNVTVEKGLCEPCDIEAVRVVKNSN